jgi:hypothetical protein
MQLEIRAGHQERTTNVMTEQNTTAELTTIDNHRMRDIVGAGMGHCDEVPPQYDSPRQGAGALVAAVYSDTGKVVSQASVDRAQRQLSQGSDWNQLCERLRSAVAPNWQP